MERGTERGMELGMRLGWIEPAARPRTAHETPARVFQPPAMAPLGSQPWREGFVKKINKAGKEINPQPPSTQAATRAGVDEVGVRSFVAP